MTLGSLRRVPVLAFGLAMPSIAVLAGLFIADRLYLVAALAAAAAVFILLVLLIGPFALSLAAVQQALDALGPQADPGAEAAATRHLGRLGATAEGLWQAAL